jgi:hypothetical protein
MSLKWVTRFQREVSLKAKGQARGHMEHPEGLVYGVLKGMRPINGVITPFVDREA